MQALAAKFAVVPGVGPLETRALRLCLRADGYPDGAMVAAMRDMTLDDALALEAVSLRRRDEVHALSELARKRAQAEAEADAAARRGAR